MTVFRAQTHIEVNGRLYFVFRSVHEDGVGLRHAALDVAAFELAYLEESRISQAGVRRVVHQDCLCPRYTASYAGSQAHVDD